MEEEAGTWGAKVVTVLQCGWTSWVSRFVNMKDNRKVALNIEMVLDDAR
jgi:hypothetical protein